MGRQVVFQQETNCSSASLKYVSLSQSVSSASKAITFKPLNKISILKIEKLLTSIKSKLKVGISQHLLKLNYLWHHEFKNEIGWASWVQLIVLGIIWGSSFILIKRSLVSLTPVEVASFRISIACLALLPFVISRFAAIDWASWHKFLFVGLTTTGIPSFCFCFRSNPCGQCYCRYSQFAYTNLYPAHQCVWMFKAPFEWGKLLGVLIGFVGAGMLVYNAGGGVHGNNAFYSLLILWLPFVMALMPTR